MYAQLLGAALYERRRQDPPVARGERLADLLRCRSQLTTNASSNGVAVAVADQLAYDAALIEFAQGLGIDVEVCGFDRPSVERRRVEQALASRGIPLYDLDEQPHPYRTGARCS